jgi:hypothetical protein
VAIPFRDIRQQGPPGLAGYLRFVMEDGDRGLRGAIFVVNALGEPKSFTSARTALRPSRLWRKGEAERAAAANLAAALFDACEESPALLLALASEVDPKLFTETLQVELPICLVEFKDERSSMTEARPGKAAELIDMAWIGTQPEAGSMARGVLDALIANGLAAEPFARAGIGLDEAFRED